MMLHRSRPGVPREPAAGPEPAAGSPFEAPAGRCRDPRARVMDAMIATVAYRGYDRTTVERVLQTAGVPAAVFDEHFADKEECFVQALDALLDRIEGGVAQAVGTAAPWPERVRAGLAALLGALAQDADGARVVLVECLSATQGASERHYALMRLFGPLLEEGRLHCADPDHLAPCTAEAMVGGVLSVAHHRALADRTGELPRLAGELAYFALLPYLGHHRALVAAYAQPARARPGGATSRR
jgi:AcrR family transcriptional regulator